METLELFLLIMAAVLLSSVVDQIVPKISSPLIQIGFGVLIALFGPAQLEITLDPELFMVVFIAPLLFDEAKNLDRAVLWKTHKTVLILAIGLVVVSTLAAGFTADIIMPFMPLAAALALGAALSPTDPVSVASLSKGTAIPHRIRGILEAESLANDATGVVTFQFAVAAAMTGAFSLLDATVDFAFSFLGGIVVGVALGYLVNFLVRRVRALGLENTTFHVLLEVLMPFIVFLVGEAVGVSSIIAVVAAGLVNVISPRTSGPAISRMNIVSTSVWRVLSFGLNGIVFVLLGTQLPGAMAGAWENPAIDNGLLITAMIALTVVLQAVRFTFLHLLRLWSERNGEHSGHGSMRMTLLMTLAGSKGTITFASLLTLPILFPQRDLVSFVASGVIVITLLVATFAVPLLAPKEQENADKAHRSEVEAALDILRGVIEELTARQTDANRAATRMVISSYNERIARIKNSNDIDDSEDEKALHLKALQWEREFVQGLIDNDDVTPTVGYHYLSRLNRIEELLSHHARPWSPRALIGRARKTARRGLHAIMNTLPDETPMPKRTLASREVQLEATRHVIARLRSMLVSSDDGAPAEAVSALLLEYQRTALLLSSENPSITTLTQASRESVEIERLGLLLELEQIQARYEDGTLSRAAARHLRENVSLMQIDLGDSV